MTEHFAGQMRTASHQRTLPDRATSANSRSQPSSRGAVQLSRRSEDEIGALAYEGDTAVTGVYRPIARASRVRPADLVSPLGCPPGVEDKPALRPLGKYHLIAALGRGGMATVYLALVAGPAGFNKLLVVKVVRDEILAGAEDGIALFWNEARLAARLIHPNIVQAYEVGEIEGRYFLAMEYLQGQSYRTVQHRTRRNRLPLAEEIRILSETARGLHHVHELKDFDRQPMRVVHRDVSPQNVFLTYDGQVKLLDFGIAKTLDRTHQSRAGVVRGKIDYIAPEQLRGDAVDARADIFSLGVMLWEAVAGRRFSGARNLSEDVKMRARLSGAEPKIRDVQPDVSPALARIIERALALDVEQRWQDAACFADALDAYLERVSAKPSAKSLSAIMKTSFAEDRQTTEKLIERQIDAIRRDAAQRSQAGRVARSAGAETPSASRASRAPVRTGGPRPFSSALDSKIVASGARPRLRRAVRCLGAFLAAAGVVGLVAAATIGLGVLYMPSPADAGEPITLRGQPVAASAEAIVQAAPDARERAPEIVLEPARQPQDVEDLSVEPARLERLARTYPQ